MSEDRDGPQRGIGHRAVLEPCIGGRERSVRGTIERDGGRPFLEMTGLPGPPQASQTTVTPSPPSSCVPGRKYET